MTLCLLHPLAPAMSHLLTLHFRHHRARMFCSDSDSHSHLHPLDLVNQVHQNMKTSLKFSSLHQQNLMFLTHTRQLHHILTVISTKPLRQLPYLVLLSHHCHSKVVAITATQLHQLHRGVVMASKIAHPELACTAQDDPLMLLALRVTKQVTRQKMYGHFLSKKMGDGIAYFASECLPGWLFSERRLSTFQAPESCSSPLSHSKFWAQYWNWQSSKPSLQRTCR